MKDYRTLKVQKRHHAIAGNAVPPNHAPSVTAAHPQSRAKEQVLGRPEQETAAINHTNQASNRPPALLAVG
jgi:hypothetical protein